MDRGVWLQSTGSQRVRHNWHDLAQRAHTKTIKGKMEPVKGISASWSPQPASSAHTLTFITISRLINYIPPLDWPPSGPPASSVSLHYRGIFTLPSTMPPATLTTINISPEPAFLIPHALHIWSVSSDCGRHVFVTSMRLNKKIPNTTANRQGGCGWGHNGLWPSGSYRGHGYNEKRWLQDSRPHKLL